MSVSYGSADWNWKVIRISNNLFVAQADLNKNGDATGGDVQMSMYPAYEQYIPIGKNKILTLKSLWFWTDDVTTEPNNLKIELTNFIPDLEQNFTLPLSYVENQTALASSLAEYVGKEIPLGIAIFNAGGTSSSLSATFRPNNLASTYKMKVTFLCKEIKK